MKPQWITIAALLSVAIIPACKKSTVLTTAPIVKFDQEPSGEVTSTEKVEDVSKSEPAFKKLNGKWTSKDEDGVTVSLVFEGENTIKIIGYEETGVGTYVADMTKDPHQISIDFGDHGIVKTIFEFQDSTNMRFQNNDPEEPVPVNFAKEAIFFKKVED